jgi:hypothetical protein
LQALSPDEFRAVVAHELGHLSGNHSRFAGFIYRVRKTWAQLLHNLEASEHKGAILFKPFLHWYVPFFNAYTFVLARADEYVADRCAAELAGAETAARALINVEVKGRVLHKEFWPAVFKRVEVEAEPPSVIFSRMSELLRQDGPPQQHKRWIEQALKQETGYEDTHPSLADRLQAMGQFPLLRGAAGDGSIFGRGESGTAPSGIGAAAPGKSAATFYLSDKLPELTARLGEDWKRQVAPQWREQHAAAREELQALQELESSAARRELTPEEKWNRVRWTIRFHGTEAALVLLRSMLDAEPDSAALHYALGRLLLEQKDENGIFHIEEAMRRDEEHIVRGCLDLYTFLSDAGRDEEAQTYRGRAEKYLERLQYGYKNGDSGSAADGEPRDRTTPRTFTVDDNTQASNPGNLRLNFARFMWAFPEGTLRFVAFLAVVGFGAAVSHWAFSIPAVLALALGAFLLVRLREHFLYGCVNPAIVVSHKPPLIAVSTDLSTGGSCYPVIKVLTHPLWRMAGGRPPVGTRLATVALYEGSGQSGHWDDFDPIAVNCATSEQKEVERVLAGIPSSEWDDLEQGLAQVPRPYQPGLYRIAAPRVPTPFTVSPQDAGSNRVTGSALPHSAAPDIREL